MIQQIRFKKDHRTIRSWLDTGQNHQTSSSYGSKGELISETDTLGRTTKSTDMEALNVTIT